MGRAKGKGRKENKKPFITSVRVSNVRVGANGPGDNDPRVMVTVTLGTKVSEMKRRIAAAEPTLRADRMNLIGMGQQLDDDEKTLADYEDIGKSCLFALLTLEQVTVQTLEGSFTKMVTTNEQVKHIKNAIERHDSDLPAASMVLVHSGAVLRDDDRLEERDVREGSVIFCLVRRPEPYEPDWRKLDSNDNAAIDRFVASNLSETMREAHREGRRWWKMARRLCDVCGRQGRISKPTFPRCNACGKRRYCDEDCQRADWEAWHSRRCEGIPFEVRHPELTDAGGSFRHPGVGPGGRLVPIE